MTSLFAGSGLGSGVDFSISGSTSVFGLMTPSSFVEGGSWAGGAGCVSSVRVNAGRLSCFASGRYNYRPWMAHKYSSPENVTFSGRFRAAMMRCRYLLGFRGNLRTNFGLSSRGSACFAFGPNLIPAASLRR
jgi:hypothetical protein